MQTGKTQNGVGASLLRKEDDRHLRGRGEFVADIALRGTQEVVFLRSPHAHAIINSISVPPASRGRVFTAADLPRIKPIQVVTQAAGARSPPWPPLATDRIRYVGEAIAACVAPTRAEAEDLAAAIDIDYRPLDAVALKRRWRWPASTPKNAAGSAYRYCARRTIATCAAEASSSRTSHCAALMKWCFCAVLTPMP